MEWDGCVNNLIVKCCDSTEKHGCWKATQVENTRPKKVDQWFSLPFTVIFCLLAWWPMGEDRVVEPKVNQLAHYFH